MCVSLPTTYYLMAIRNDCKIINETNRVLPDVVTVLPISFSYFYETHTHTHIISVCAYRVTHKALYA